MTDREFDIFVKEQDFIEADFFEESFKFWFEDNESIRSPFPVEIQNELKEKTLRVFMEWVFELSEEETAKLEKEEIAETFEMILFNQALGMVEDEDRKITICYPFMPRLGDVVDDEKRGLSKVVERKVDLKKDDRKYLKVKLKSETVAQEWETEFELPA